MLGKTRRLYIWLGLLFVTPVSVAWPKPAPSTATVRVSVYNDVGVPVGSLIKAEKIATSVFADAGMNVEWINCPLQTPTLSDGAACRKAIFPNNLQMRIVARPISLSDSAFGVSYMSADGVGCYTNVFFERVEQLQRTFKQSSAVVLGHVMAHEIAHLLLGTNSHSAFGIMRAHWYRQDLDSASRGGLLFTGTESKRMREKVLAASQANSEMMAAAAMTMRTENN